MTHLLTTHHAGQTAVLLRLKTEFFIDHYSYPLYRSAVFAIPVARPDRDEALARVAACFPRDKRTSGYFLSRIHDLDEVLRNVAHDRSWTDPIVEGTTAGTDPHFTIHLADLLYY